MNAWGCSRWPTGEGLDGLKMSDITTEIPSYGVQISVIVSRTSTEFSGGRLNLQQHRFFKNNKGTCGFRPTTARAAPVTRATVG
ncbi:uncharacterized protein VDAG_06184 [Verticillium dahliae VdLs.17]|uniref:Uncharacterized protein n=1 Tax=Verticillium dahliae (strain VdLs.17 / ATCC MYA-4575 / FGSC 10137) TaxID=498257 RepID=G2X8P3_VERDV|nr:uncharacterized protein VDAG_06184 [Verticillium dahliae VdLs.17]EGY15330.1 hypothetical protein VDAG_06184 [Verticillium dahliae VdLs.17]